MNLNSSRARPARLRERLREVAVEAILESSEQVFAADGPRALKESIAGRAGIALYNHFADRESLRRDLCLRGAGPSR